MALHPDFPESPYTLLDLAVRWFSADTDTTTWTKKALSTTSRNRSDRWPRGLRNIRREYYSERKSSSHLTCLAYLVGVSLRLRSGNGSTDHSNSFSFILGAPPYFTAIGADVLSSMVLPVCSWRTVSAGCVSVADAFSPI